MADNVNICKAGLQYCEVNGYDCQFITHCIRIYESMCKPYRTAEVILLNGDGQVNEIGLQIGDEVRFMIIDSRGKTYQMTSYVSAIPEMINADSLREDMVTVGTVTTEFMRDRANLVQGTYSNIPFTAAAAMIHGEKISTPLQLLSQSSGPAATDQSGGHHVEDQKPFTAIRKLLALATNSQYKTGSYVYFANKIASVMAPLEQLMTSAPVATDLIQKDTWGIHALHSFGFDDAIKIVIASKVYHKETTPESGGAGAQVAASQSVRTVFDRALRNPLMEAALTSSIPKFSKWAQGSPTGRPLSDMLTDSKKWPNATAPFSKQAAESAYQAKVRDGTNYLVKTTIESGFLPQFTAGNRVTAELMAPLTSPTNTINVTLLVADCMHEAYFDNRIVNGTTTIRGVVTTV